MSTENTELPRTLTSNLERNVCTCYDVPKRTLIEAYQNGAITFEQLSQRTYACQGSACCEAQVKKLLATMHEHLPDQSAD